MLSAIDGLQIQCVMKGQGCDLELASARVCVSWVLVPQIDSCKEPAKGGGGGTYRLKKEEAEKFIMLNWGPNCITTSVSFPHSFNVHCI